MSRYIVQRLLVALPVLFAVTVIVTSIVPGLFRLHSEHWFVWQVFAHGYYTPGDLDWVRTEMGMDQSFGEYYLSWLGQALRGDLGESLYTGRGALGTIAARAPVSMGVMLIALPTALACAAASGVIAAVEPGGRLDRWLGVMFRAGAATPEFVMAILTIYVLVLLGWGPLPYNPVWGVLEPESSGLAVVVGGIVVGWYVGAGNALRVRSAVLCDQLGSYVLAAEAKGLSPAAAAARHAARNVALPVLRVTGRRLPVLLGSVLMVEVVFGLPGVGNLAFGVVAAHDYPVVQGVLLVSAMAVIGVNLAVDAACAALDPRIRDATRDTRGDARPDYAL